MVLFSQAFFLVLFFASVFFSSSLWVACELTPSTGLSACLTLFFGYDAAFVHVFIVCQCVYAKVSARYKRRESQSSYVITAAESAGFSISSSRYIFQNTYFSWTNIQTPVCLCISKSFVHIVLLFRDLIYTHTYICISAIYVAIYRCGLNLMLGQMNVHFIAVPNLDIV